MPRPPRKIEKKHLRIEEKERLRELEAVIQKDVQAFYRVGEALAEISACGLFREDFETFEAYVKIVWGFQKRTAYQYIEAKMAIDHLRAVGAQNSDSAPMAHTGTNNAPLAHEMRLPANERQARPLTRLKNPDDQVRAWVEVCREADETGKKITSGLVGRVVSRMLNGEKEASQKEESEKIKQIRLQVKMQTAINELCHLIENEAAHGYPNMSRADIEDRINLLKDILLSRDATCKDE